MKVPALRTCVAILAVACAAAGSSLSKAVATSASSSASSASASSTSSSSAAPAAAADWTSWGHDGANSGVTDDAPSPEGLHEAWESVALDGDVYAQPLVVGGDVIVATENNSVYAFNAVTGELHWQQLHLGDPLDGSTLPCGNVDPLGITSTPVVDRARKLVYVVGMMQPAHHQLLALDLDTGNVSFSVPVDATGADPLVHNQRG